MTTITPFLWYEKDAKGIIRYYQQIFGKENVKASIDLEADTEPSGPVEVATMTIFNQTFRMMTAGKHHEFNDAVSFEVKCKDQAEIDRYWDAIVAEGKAVECSWCIDKYGVRWQIVPFNMDEYVSDPRGMQAMMKMKKIIIADLQAAIK